MARYIDADALLVKLKERKEEWGFTFTADGVEEAIFAVEEELEADVVSMTEYEQLVYKLECLLCHATAGRLSKHTYDLRTMETVVTDYTNETYNDGFGEGYKECAREIFEEIEALLAQYTFEDNYGYYISTGVTDEFAEHKKKYTEEKK